MFSKVNFKEYSDNRKNFYDNLSQFSINASQISDPIKIDAQFIQKLNTHLSHFIDKRLGNEKFSREDNRTFKNLIKEHCPEALPVFEHRGPTIYWFKINHSSNTTNEEIIKYYYNAKKSGSGWWTKVNPSKKDNATQVLYLGKIEAGFENRFIQHIGLGHNFTTALKLQRWLPIDISFSFQFLKLDGSIKPYLEDIEKVMWEECKPLLGEAPRIK